MDRRSRARQIVDFVDLDMKANRDVVAHDFKTRVVEEMRDVLASAGIVIVDAKHFVAVGEKPLAKMRANKARAAGNERPYAGKLIE